MIKITETEVFGFRAAFRDMRNPMESWDRSDSCFGSFLDKWRPLDIYVPELPVIGPEDMRLALKLVAGGTEHRKFLRQIVINAVFEAPRYLWQEIDTYKVATVRNSCSTMHKLGHRDLVPGDFEASDISPSLLDQINVLGLQYREGGKKDFALVARMKRLLPEGYLQRAGYHMNYETALSMFRQRANHRLLEWRFTPMTPPLPGACSAECSQMFFGSKSIGQPVERSICNWIYLLPCMSDFISALEKKGL